MPNQQQIPTRTAKASPRAQTRSVQRCIGTFSFRDAAQSNARLFHDMEHRASTLVAGGVPKKFSSAHVVPQAENTR